MLAENHSQGSHFHVDRSIAGPGFLSCSLVSADCRGRYVGKQELAERGQQMIDCPLLNLMADALQCGALSSSQRFADTEKIMTLLRAVRRLIPSSNCRRAHARRE